MALAITQKEALLKHIHIRVYSYVGLGTVQVYEYIVYLYIYRLPTLEPNIPLYTDIGFASN